jgi:hypothetical protein
VSHPVEHHVLGLEVAVDKGERFGVHVVQGEGNLRREGQLRRVAKRG